MELSSIWASFVTLLWSSSTFSKGRSLKYYNEIDVDGPNFWWYEQIKSSFMDKVIPEVKWNKNPLCTPSEAKTLYPWQISKNWKLQQTTSDREGLKPDQKEKIETKVKYGTFKSLSLQPTPEPHNSDNSNCNTN